MVERRCRDIRGEIKHTGDPKGENAPQASDRIGELEKANANFAGSLDDVSKRLSSVEEAVKRHNEDPSGKDNSLEEKYVAVLLRIEELSRQMGNSSQARQVEDEKDVVQLPQQTQTRVQDRASPPEVLPNEAADVPKESRDDLLRQFNGNLAEIKNLCSKNPACFLNSSPRSIINLSKRIATAKDRQYCTANNITLIREKFYCTACKKESDLNAMPCCNVSRKMSSNRWVEARKSVDETAEINGRIDELRRENEALAQKIRALQR